MINKVKSNIKFQNVSRIYWKNNWWGYKLVYGRSSLNGFSDSYTEDKFKEPENKAIVNNKFQTGFDEPLLQTMYVDKKMHDLQMVQTLSRLNRTSPGKIDTFVLDFKNEEDEVKVAFQKYFKETKLTECDPNVLYDLNQIFKNSIFLQLGI